MGDEAGQRARSLPPALLCRAAGEAAAALRLAAGRRVLLLSGPGAAGFLGAAGWLALVAAAEATAPGAPFEAALCCGASPGHALAALRAGCRILVLEGSAPAFGQVAAAAAATGALVLPARPAALDLRGLDLRRPGGAARLARWLEGHPHDSAPAKG